MLSWVNHPRALPLAVPAATVHMAAMRGMEVVVLRPEGFALPAPIMQKAAQAAAAARRFGARNHRPRRRADRRARGVRQGMGLDLPLRQRRGRRAPARSALADWCVRDTWFSRAAVDCKLMHCLPVRRNVAVADEVLDGRRSVVQREAYNRMVVQTAVLHRLLSTPQH